MSQNIDNQASKNSRTGTVSVMGRTWTPKTGKKQTTATSTPVPSTSRQDVSSVSSVDSIKLTSELSDSSDLTLLNAAIDMTEN